MAQSKVKRSKSKTVLDLLRAYESQNVTFIEADESWPIVWERAKGVHVWDANGKKYLDLTAAFGVAAAGHANRAVVHAGQEQMARLLHAMGDVHPHRLKARLARELSRLTFERWANEKSNFPGLKSKGRGFRHTAGSAPVMAGKSIFCNSGFEAVEVALKTALLATSKPGVIAFEGAYHGLGYGALNATHREHFRSPFRSQLREFGCFVPFPSEGPARYPISTRSISKQKENSSRGLASIESQIRRLFRRKEIGAVLVEPIQVRGGIKIPTPEFLPLLRRLCNEHHALLILDEIYTGFGRTGKWFACEHWGVVPDLVCLGKALTGGFPLSACVGRGELMDAAWPPSCGEAIHTSTFLGHPVGCAMALTQIQEIEQRSLVERSAELGKFLVSALSAIGPQLSLISPPAGTSKDLKVAARGLGLLAGVELRRGDGSPATEDSLSAIKSLLHRGFIFLPEGEHASVISFTPPLTISKKELRTAVEALRENLLTTLHE